MVMNQRRWIIVAVIATLLIAAIIGFVLWLQSRPEPSTTTNTNTVVTLENTNTTTTTNSSENTNIDTPRPTSVERSERQAITGAATSFTERFGSYSSDTNFENIERSRYLMTAAMESTADDIIEDGQSDAQFTSVDSTVAGVAITDYADGSTGATVEVSVRQTQRVGQGTTTYENKTARLTLEKEGDRWLVDSFRWL